MLSLPKYPALMCKVAAMVKAASNSAEFVSKIRGFWCQDFSTPRNEFPFLAEFNVI